MSYTRDRSIIVAVVFKFETGSLTQADSELTLQPKHTLNL